MLKTTKIIIQNNIISSICQNHIYVKRSIIFIIN
uniref:Uncharacterized protein n=1 Tax=Anguilla anguilla TaxID=7936 RepID=A0A0E9QBP6_ANGAN